MSVVIGTIADDYTGATDVAVAFRRGGLRTLLYFGVPNDPVRLPPHDVLVVAQRIRTAPAAMAISASLASLEWLQQHGANNFYFKYCSTFDSTPAGNIGSVLDALSDALSAATVLQTPSAPEHGRTQYQGYLFVENVLLSESHMRWHPLTPMTDSSVRRVLSEQTTRPIATIPHATVRAGADAVRSAVASAQRDGVRYLLADAVDLNDLSILGDVAVDYPLVAGSSGLAGGIARAIAVGRDAPAPAESDDDLASCWPAAVLSGSCSARTLEQLTELKKIGRPTYRLDALAYRDPTSLADHALAWYDGLTGDAAPVIYSSLPALELARVQAKLGVEISSRILETAIGLVARGLLARGVRRIVAAGGETSGAIVSALGVAGGLVGPEAATGVPWIYANHPVPIALLLKSGNFGEADLLATASSRDGKVTNS